MSSQYVDEDPDSIALLDDGEIEEDSENEYSRASGPRKRRRQGNPDDGDEDEDEREDERALPNLTHKDPANFFKLSAALKIILAHRLNDADIDAADTLLREYCLELMEVCTGSYVH